ncbi:MerR family transcriptional regulator [Saccharomonospora glauca]|jgi:DNA-binding transcriptional MerR regulator|uniref:Putative transcriptional regulator n=1 Tax=Saccharomonospora glauca K62 TaxID=928724 RepID=I1CWZ7_9PSEU|nr:MerR family transcriptional regulator [Saccharomonospora glauca]EIE97221.1 putative transcriptional regulator [Saccharomonospora glauca K62]
MSPAEEVRVHRVDEHMRIGEVSARTGLSLRTIRYYEEVGLVTPSARSQGGFRLYTEPDVARLNLVRRMKPLGFQLDEMKELLDLLYPAQRDGVPAPLDEHELRRLREFTERAERRCEQLRATLDTAEDFAAMLRDSLARHLERARHP